MARPRAAIGIICVTYNRLALLRELLAAYERQEEFIKAIVVVDNHSSDGTAEFLDLWATKTNRAVRTVVHLPENSGGSGGFHEGFRLFAETDRSVDFVYVSDDDAFPEEHLFERFANRYSDTPSDVLAICAAVHSFGRIDIMHRRRIARKGLVIVEEPVSEEEYSAPFDLNAYSFVGTFLRIEAVRTTPPQRRFFIHYDDTEHALAVRKSGRILCDPDLHVRHDTLEPDDVFSWKRYYSARNKLITYRRHFSRITFLASWLWEIHWCVRYSRKKVDGRKVFVWKRLAVFARALIDALRDRQGLHPKYVPGWKCE